MSDCILCFSGGIDSTTLLYDLLSKGKKPLLFTIIYGQCNEERIAIWNNVQKVNLEYKVLPLTIYKFPDGWIAARNLVILAHAVSLAEEKGLDETYYGANTDDYQDFPDCGADFVSALNQTLKFATKHQQVRFSVPHINMNKKAIMQIGKLLNVDYSICYSDKIINL